MNGDDGVPVHATGDNRDSAPLIDIYIYIYFYAFVHIFGHFDWAAVSHRLVVWRGVPFHVLTNENVKKKNQITSMAAGRVDQYGTGVREVKTVQGCKCPPTSAFTNAVHPS